MTDPRPGDGPADRLKAYWAVGAGRAKWAGSPRPWTTLNALLKRHGVPRRQVDGLTTNIMKMAGVSWTGEGKDRQYKGPIAASAFGKLKPKHKDALRKIIGTAHADPELRRGVGQSSKPAPDPVGSTKRRRR